MTSHQADDYFDGFSWAVPVAFAEPLAACRFEEGDILYDTRRAYEGTWGEALPHIKHSIQVRSPMRGPGTKPEKEEESVFTDNWNMTVVFTLTDYKANKTKEITTTQGGYTHSFGKAISLRSSRTPLRLSSRPSQCRFCASSPKRKVI
jgi:hypothetical protein